MDISDANGDVTIEEFVLTQDKKEYTIVRPSTATITSGTDIVTLAYKEYDGFTRLLCPLSVLLITVTADHYSLDMRVCWCDPSDSH